MSDSKFNFGLVGLGVMGRNFILNVADKGFSVSGLDLDSEKVESLKSEGQKREVFATSDKTEFIESLSSPRKIMLLVPAGKPVDSVIADLKPLLNQGDIIIDGGNSFFTDTDRRFEELAKEGIHFFGSGVSGGSKGARKGPSIMPGGDENAYEHIRPIFEAASAKVNGEPCVAHLGRGSAGNYVKMVHNGIEYAMMQLIAETYDLMKTGCGLNNSEIHETFKGWNEGRLRSFLIEITASIFNQKDDLSEGDLIDQILDKGKQKGTGKWTSQNAMDLGIPIPTIDAAVSMREISGLKDLRKIVDAKYNAEKRSNLDVTVEDLEALLYFSFIMSYAQGMHMLFNASREYKYDLDLEVISKIWRGGCIIRADILEQMRKAYDSNVQLEHLLTDDWFIDTVSVLTPQVRKTISKVIESGIPSTALVSTLNYFNSFTSGRLPMNLVQAQRDHFGSHTYERLDREGVFHTEWED